MPKDSNIFWRKVVPAVNVLLVVVCICGNISSNAGFCRPVLWAAIVQAVSFLNIISFTWVEQTRLKSVNALLCGISTCVYIYWCIFLGGMTVLMPVPLWFVFLLVWHNMVRPAFAAARWWYLAGVLLCVLFALGCGKGYSSACKAYDEGRVPDGNPMTERIAGMKFLYHTKYCPYDGWRPPLHDPALVLGMRLDGNRDPLADIDLEGRVALYREMYPDRPVVRQCACSVESGRNGYFTDTLWEEDGKSIQRRKE